MGAKNTTLTREVSTSLSTFAQEPMDESALKPMRKCISLRSSLPFSSSASSSGSNSPAPSSAGSNSPAPSIEAPNKAKFYDLGLIYNDVMVEMPENITRPIIKTTPDYAIHRVSKLNADLKEETIQKYFDICFGNIMDDTSSTSDERSRSPGASAISSVRTC